MLQEQGNLDFNDRIADSSFAISTTETIEWGKSQMKPVAEPGKKHLYTDTNYYLLGFIVECISSKPFHATMHEMIFELLGMTHAWMQGFPTVGFDYGY